MPQIQFTADSQSEGNLQMGSLAKAKRLTRWQLSRNREYRMLKFCTTLTGFLLGVALLLLLLQPSDQVWSFRNLSFSYLALTFALSLATCWRVRGEVIRENDLSRLSRNLGLVFVILGLFGNFFLQLAGFYLLDRHHRLECQLAIYAFVANWMVFLISLLNLFKEYVSNQFFIGLGLNLAMAIILLVMVFLTSSNCMYRTERIHPLLFVAALVTLAITLSGNLFALMAALVIISKYRRPESEIEPQWIEVISRLFRNNMCMIGLLYVTFLIIMSILSKFTFEPSLAEENNYLALFIKPCLEYPFGTDSFGRDIFTRVVLGAQISLVVGFWSTMIPAFAGGLLGAMAGYFGGRFDNITMRILDILYAVPGMLLAITVVAAFGTSTFNLVMALSLSGIPGYARIVRGSVLTVANNEFVEAAKACGAKNLRIITKHIIPNALAPVIVTMTMGIGTAVLSTSALSYLGLGVEPHVPEWGNILKIGSAYLEQQPYLAVIPGVAIILILLAFNFFGDGLRDALDPKLK